ncbi:MAG TPA: phosphoribosylglycinamide formyltransferase [Anaerolineae bacterium]|nr:phosphoribosylglycinamide formyltransferase [Anaerolineae bacterium]
MACRVVVLISGSGTNLQALLDASAEGGLEAEVVLVVSNRRQAYGLTRAGQANVSTLYFPLKPYLVGGDGREAYDADLAQLIKSFKPDLIILAGWMHILSPVFLNEFPQRVLNLHPALPGQFAGTHAIERAYEAYQRGEIEHSGCMVHYAVPEVDAGPVVGQAIVPLYPDDTLETFEARVHAAEHRLIVECVARACQSLGQ